MTTLNKKVSFSNNKSTIVTKHPRNSENAIKRSNTLPSITEEEAMETPLENKMPRYDTVSFADSKDEEISNTIKGFLSEIYKDGVHRVEEYAYDTDVVYDNYHYSPTIIMKFYTSYINHKYLDKIQKYLETQKVFCGYDIHPVEKEQRSLLVLSIRFYKQKVELKDRIVEKRVVRDETCLKKEQSYPGNLTDSDIMLIDKSTDLVCFCEPKISQNLKMQIKLRKKVEVDYSGMESLSSTFLNDYMKEMSLICVIRCSIVANPISLCVRLSPLPGRHERPLFVFPKAKRHKKNILERVAGWVGVGEN